MLKLFSLVLTFVMFSSSSNLWANPKPTQISKSYIKQIRSDYFKISSEWVSNPQSLADFLNSGYAEANKAKDNKNSKLQGFKIMNLDKGGPLEKMGFQKGDVVSHLNGQRIESLTMAHEFYLDLLLAPSGSKYVVKFFRQQKPQSMTYEIE